MTTEPRAFARRLRRQATAFEDGLWQQLRGRRLAGTKWRRQAPVSPYVVDFLCPAARLVVEVDGAQHGADALYDARRSAELEAQGLTVIRFTNAQVRDRLPWVLDAIRQALTDAGHTLTPPAGTAGPLSREGEGSG